MDHTKSQRHKLEDQIWNHRQRTAKQNQTNQSNDLRKKKFSILLD